MEAGVSARQPAVEKTNAAEATKEIVVGAAGGITQVLIVQPFDIVKVRMQTQVNENALRVAQKIWEKEGPLAFYKFIKRYIAELTRLRALWRRFWELELASQPSPARTSHLTRNLDGQISIVYSTFHDFSHVLNLLHSEMASEASHPMALSHLYLAGGLAGLANSAISGPLEHIRICLQMEPSHTGQKTYSGVHDCFRRILQEGGLAGLYRGQTATMLREFHSYGIWFSIFELSLSQVLKMENKQRDEIASWKIAGCGALTGQILWTANYPFDLVKSKMQADRFGK
ncbi:LOW QUALITY PROTEIN: carrier protein [Aspergillus udagawae]|uniref:Carrier protein n=1 Tax=Aspergillus udagawae TaxID=91492 RepID=A0A8H3SD55_9EURO|nr:LOW QUALITY PROTEIN: carrier protein [Aspergillus udagawae]